MRIERTDDGLFLQQESKEDGNLLDGFLKLLQTDIEGVITKRINMFHDALVERGQIKPIPPKEEWTKHASP